MRKKAASPRASAPGPARSRRPGGFSSTPGALRLRGAASAAATAHLNTGRPHPGMW